MDHINPGALLHTKLKEHDGVPVLCAVQAKSSARPLLESNNQTQMILFPLARMVPLQTNSDS